MPAAKDYVRAADKQRDIQVLRDDRTPRDGASAAATQWQKQSVVLLSAYKKDLKAFVVAKEYVRAAEKHQEIEALLGRSSAQSSAVGQSPEAKAASLSRPIVRPLGVSEPTPNDDLSKKIQDCLG